MIPRIKGALIVLIFYLCAVFIHETRGHGRLIEPPSRASAWRYGFQTPPNYNDHELYCGGYNRQWSKNEGKCGECGDAYDAPKPRPHEYGGKWGQGVIVRKYNPDGDITIRVELTASHMGFFEFRICPDANGKQDCLDKHILKVAGGSPMIPAPADLNTRFYPRNGSRIYEIKAKLPSGLKCNHCLLQWRYVAGNNWGTCEDGTGAVGCGPQEEFRACADISIGDTGKTTMRPFRPGIKTTTPTTPTTESKQPEPGTGEEFPRTIYISLLIVLISLLAVVCVLAAIYLYHYHGQRVKQLLRWKHKKDPISPGNDVSTSVLTDSTEIEGDGSTMRSPTAAPVPPPRTKRLSQSQVREISPDEASIVMGQQSNA